MRLIRKMIRLVLAVFLLDRARALDPITLYPVTVTTLKGPITGYNATANGYNYATYFGVPYATVDEDNPFGNSHEHPTFIEPFHANDSTIRCPQAYFTPGGVIQCLTLNIYVPYRDNTSTPMPIFVWFHGGGFAFGSSGEYDGQYLIQHEVIVVTVNYRLGPYGFLCLDDPKVPGNQGLKDQISALRWIRKNIYAFGGDAGSVTIAGESYGGGGVDLHLYSSYETLFHKAIIQSGCLLDEGFFKKPDYNAAIKLTQELGYNVKTTKEALSLLAKQEPLAVMDAAKNLSMLLTVCKEKDFIGVPHFVTEDPYHLSNARVKDIPILIGYTSKEDFYTFFNQTEEFYKNLGNIFYNKLNNTFVLSTKELTTLSNMVRSYYLGSKRIGPESSLELIDFNSDFIINYPTEWSVNKFIKQDAKVYKYVFSYVGGSQYENQTGVGAYHTEELRYLFKWIFAEDLVTNEQRQLRTRMTTMWTNFAKYGNPTPTVTELLPTIWQAMPLNGSSRPYLNIDASLTMMDYVYKERMAFWELFWHAYERKAIINSQGGHVHGIMNKHSQIFSII